MSASALGIVVFEFSMLLVQLMQFCVQRDRKQLRYATLLILLLVNNLCRMAFLNQHHLFSIELQSAVGGTMSFLLAVYSGYFFYKAFDLKHIRFFVPNRALLSAPFVALFILPELNDSVRLVITPFLFSACVIYCTTRLLLQQWRHYAEEVNSESMKVLLSVYAALVFWAAMPVLSLLGNFQAWDFILTNVGFIGMTIIYVHVSVTEIKRKFHELELSKHTVVSINKVEVNCQKYKFTRKEIEVANLIISGQTSKVIADGMHISRHTVNKHISNIFRKTNVNNKADLINKLNL